MGHLGLTPQYVNSFGGYRVQGRGDAGDVLLEAAVQLETAGAFCIVLECVPAELATRVTEALTIPTIGIGAGAGTTGQVMVFHDLLGLTPDPAPRFVKRYADLTSEIGRAVKAYAKDIAEGTYPGPEHEYH
jgi:3-methyl-2-oxobutanoate hydroxymethyltransferase